jgi:hypothetical protein
MKKVLLLLVSVLNFCTEYPIKEISKGEHLDKAIESTLDHFLNLRMKNSIKKIIAHNTEIIHEANQKVYYGFVKGSNFDNLYVKEFYFVDQIQLIKLFPAYQKLTGIEIKKEIYKSKALDTKFTSTLIQNHEFEFKLTEKGIESKVIWTYKVDGGSELKKRFLFLLDSNTGKVILFNELK